MGKAWAASASVTIQYHRPRNQRSPFPVASLLLLKELEGQFRSVPHTEIDLPYLDISLVELMAGPRGHTEGVGYTANGKCRIRSRRVGAR